MIKPTLYAAALLAVSSAAFAPMPASAQVDVNLVIGTAPPPLRYESLPPPRHGYVWAPGYWNWNGHRHVWVSGHWLVERPGLLLCPAAMGAVERPLDPPRRPLGPTRPGRYGPRRHPEPL